MFALPAKTGYWYGPVAITQTTPKRTQRHPMNTKPPMHMYRKRYEKLLRGLYFHVFVVLVVVYVSRDVNRVLRCAGSPPFSHPRGASVVTVRFPQTTPNRPMDITEKEFESVLEDWTFIFVLF